MLSISGHRYYETIILTAMIIGLCFYFNPQDPLLTHTDFPWLWLFPVLIGIRHGRICAFITLLFITMAMIYTIYTSLFSWDSYQSWFLGGTTLILIYTEYQNSWLLRQSKQHEKQKYLNTRLESLSRAYGMLRLSHDTLEESLIVKPTTMRQAFMALRELIIKTGGILNSEIAIQYLQLLAYYGGLNSAALFLYTNKQWDTKSVAFIGKDCALNTNDILVKRCLKKHEVSYVALNLLEDNQVSDYLAVLPIQTAAHETIGIMTISDMPFLVLNEETLKKLALMLAYIADDVWAATHARKLHEIYPDCPSMFAVELFKLTNLWKIGQVDSSIVIYRIKPGPLREDIIFYLIKERRALDIIWETTDGKDTMLIILMPLTQRNMLIGYIERMKNLLWQQKRITLGENTVLLEQRQLSTYGDPYKLLNGLFQNEDSFDIV